MSVQATFYFDVISPWSYLVDVMLRRDPLPVDLQLRPVLFAGLLNHFGHKGPAEIERKRQFTYELATWTAQQLDIPFRMHEPIGFSGVHTVPNTLQSAGFLTPRKMAPHSQALLSATER